MLAYLQIFADQEEELNMLDDAARGRLLSALLAYATRGEVIPLTGEERLLFPSFRRNIDQAAAKLETQQANGSKGGRPKNQHNHTKPNETQQNPTITQENPRKPNHNPTKPNETQQNHIQEQEQEHIYTTTTTNNAGAREEPFALTDAEVDAYRENLAAIEDTARSIGLPFEPGDIRMVDSLMADYTPEWVLEAVRRTQYRKRTWGVVRGILQSWKAKGAIDDAEYRGTGERPGSPGKGMPGYGKSGRFSGLNDEIL